jgi:glycosyltransferase involved in cell wall biosynthesis
LQNRTKLEGGIHTKGLLYKKNELGRPLVSIITVVRNGEKYLEDTIKSVINQTYENLEYIIIDGGSTDGTLDILRKYDDYIYYWISEPDEGIYYAMNKGIDIASGEWINFMNAGDRFYDTGIISKVFSEYPKDAEVFYGDSEIRYESYDDFSRIQKAGDVKDLWKGMLYSHQSLFSKTLLMKEYKFNTNNKVAADFEFAYQMFKKNCKFFNTGIIISSVDAGGLSDTNRFDSIKDHWNVVKKFSSNFLIDLYYFFWLFDTIIRVFVKKILPEKLIRFLIQNFK